jgi:hypothetical protein
LFGLPRLGQQSPEDQSLQGPAQIGGPIDPIGQNPIEQLFPTRGSR